MKKLLALLLAVVMLLSVMALTGCEKDEPNPSTPNSGNNENNDPGNNENPGNSGDTTDLYALVSAAMQKTLAAKAFSGQIKSQIKQNLMGSESETKAEYTIQGNLADSAKPIIGFNGSVTMYEQELPTAYYYDGAVMYIVEYGNGYKMDGSFEEFMEKLDMNAIVRDLPKELFDGATATTEGDTTKVEVPVESETFKTIHNDFLVDLFYDVLGEYISPVVAENAKIVITVKNGYAVGYELSVKANYTIGNDFIIYDVVQTTTLDSVDQDVTVTPPEGYQDFGYPEWG